MNPRPSGLRLWLLAIRPKTLTLASMPVLAGGALAWSGSGVFRPLPLLLTLVAALAVQAGTNLHNDAADHRAGVDHGPRLGPPRATAMGWAPAATVVRAAHVSFLIAWLAGAYLIWLGGWFILLLALLSTLAGYAYTGGPRPISTTPYGEVMVLLFFGVAAVSGTHWLQTGGIPPAAPLTGVILGLPAAAVLLVNNHRDRSGDAAAGRRTLAILLGSRRTRHLYALLQFLPLALLPLLARLTHPGALLALLALPLAWRCSARMTLTPPGSGLNGLLVATAQSQVALTLLLILGWLLPLEW